MQTRRAFATWRCKNALTVAGVREIRPLWLGRNAKIVQNDTIAVAPLAGGRPRTAPVTTNWLLGTWRLYRADAALDFAPGVRMEFASGGKLRYHIDVAGSDQIVDLLYRIEGDILHTENVITPHALSVRFAREGEDVLALDFGGASAWLLREYPDATK
jgi:hypothetical protein